MTDSGLVPFRLRPSDADRYMALRRSMLADSPWAFLASEEDDRALDPADLIDSLADEYRAIFAIEDVEDRKRVAIAGDLDFQPGLIAAAGIARSNHAKTAHRAIIWGTFVEPGHRGRGLGRAVMTAAIELAREWEGVDLVDIGVSENAPAAQGLYESLGFVAWGREPDAIQTGGRRYDEIHMTLRL